MRTIRTLLSLFLLALVAGAGFIWTGAYPIGADVPHWPLVYNLLEITRQRSIALRAKDIRVPALDDPKLIAEGGEHYGAMCSGCHLAPGMTDSEISQGLYPQPPDLTKSRPASAAEEFWAIKHGIKLSAMPAWGTTHDDQAIWGLVAFLQKLPGMTPEKARAFVLNRPYAAVSDLATAGFSQQDIDAWAPYIYARRRASTTDITTGIRADVE